MIKEVLSLAANLQTRSFRNLDGLQKAYVKIVRAPSEQRVAADCRSRKSHLSFYHGVQ